MKIEIELSELAIRLLGPDHRATAEKLIEAEALRRWHIERSRPKKGRDVAKRLKAIYDRQRTLLGDVAFERVLGGQFRRLETAIATEDAATMNEFISQQPWVRASRGPLTKQHVTESKPKARGGSTFAEVEDNSTKEDPFRPGG